jgi:ABC-type multidrug transport system fused ATPase/permease subunit
VPAGVDGAAGVGVRGIEARGLQSTLLRCPNRLVAPDAGEVLLHGRDIRELEPRELRRRVGLVTQAPVMLPGTVRDSVLYAIEEPGEGVAVRALRELAVPA